MVCRRIKPMSDADLRRMWLDPRETMTSMSAKAGCSYDTIAIRARRLRLPSRLEIRDTTRIDRGELFRAMWRAGVSGYAIAGYFGVHQSSVSRVAAELGLEPRKAGQQPHMTLAQFAEALLAARMKAARAAEVARQKGQPVPVAPVDLEALFPARHPLTVSGQSWAHLHGLGLTAAEAAGLLGRDVRTARRWAAKCGLIWKGDEGRPPPGQSAVLWRALFDCGLTAAEAAAERGLSPDAARLWARKAGLVWPDRARECAA